jgi:hypothetical protein
MEIYEIMREYGRKVSDMGLSGSDGTRLLMRERHLCFATAEGADLSDLSREDIVDVTGGSSPEKAALLNSAEYNSMIISKPPFAGSCIDHDLEIPAVLDDMAMIVGLKVRIVERNKLEIARALKRTSAVMVRDGMLLTCGRNMFEAYTCLTVLEKNAEIFRKSEVFGGAAAVRTIPGFIEHLVYLRKYSKAEKEIRDASEGRK